MDIGLARSMNRSAKEATMCEFERRVFRELLEAREKHAPMNSAHEAYAVILEEVDEFFEEVKRKARSKEHMLSELVQIAAMCQRAAEDLNLSYPE